MVPFMESPQRDAPPLEPSFIHLSKSAVHEPPPSNTRIPSDGKKFPCPENFLAYLLESTVKELPPRPPPRSLCREVPHQGPYGERSFISRANGLFIHLYLSESPIRSPPTKNGRNIWSPSAEPHVDGRPTYNEVRPGSLRGSFKTLQSLPQCHAGFSTIPSTLAWVYQSPVSQHVS
jgi:hypothetical protein